jgi:hypothetical protein
VFCVIGVGEESFRGSVVILKQRLWREYRVILQGGLFGLVLLGSGLGAGRCGYVDLSFSSRPS